AGSNDSLDLLADLKTFALVQRHASGDPTVLPAAEALEIASAGVEEGRLFCAYGADWAAAPNSNRAAADQRQMNRAGSAKSAS
ncbi:MAG TPA: hypothetical protein VNN23_14200, partial [Ornithinibacter sp.]|nr:hypothetical protein [Ornithinibacter sp.]